MSDPGLDPGLEGKITLKRTLMEQLVKLKYRLQMIKEYHINVKFLDFDKYPDLGTFIHTEVFRGKRGMI